MNIRQEYKKKAREEKKVYFHFEIDRKHAKENGGSWEIWSCISLETAKKLEAFFDELQKQKEF